MLEFVSGLSYWSWASIALILLACELFGTGGYALWLSIAAACVALASFLLPVPIALQFGLFATLALAFAVAWYRYQRRTTDGQPVLLNARGSELHGRQFAVHEAIINGRGKIRAGDTLWLVTGPDLPAGAWVTVVGQQGVTLEVKAATSE